MFKEKEIIKLLEEIICKLDNLISIAKSKKIKKIEE